MAPAAVVSKVSQRGKEAQPPEAPPADPPVPERPPPPPEAPPVPPPLTPPAAVEVPPVPVPVPVPAPPPVPAPVVPPVSVPGWDEAPTHDGTSERSRRRWTSRKTGICIAIQAIYTIPGAAFIRSAQAFFASADFKIMPASLFDILLVMVGAASMAGGFFIGSWHRRFAQRDEIDAADLASDERMTRMIRSLIHDDVIDDERPN
jgi:hypothetical protein